MSVCRRCGKALPPAAGPRERVWCSDRCRKAASRLSVVERPENVGLPPASNVLEAVKVLLAECPFEEGDPRAVISVVVLRLAEEFDARPSASVARELKSQVEWLVIDPNRPADFIDELRARHAARRVGLFVKNQLDEGA